jgi:hypothetical protein
MSADLPIEIYVPDAAYGQDGSKAESRKFLQSLIDEYNLPFKETDIGTGAGEPAFVTQILEWWPVAGGAAVFFAGKKIEENLEAWTKIFARLKPFFKHKAVFGRDGAAVLAVEGVRSAMGNMPKSVRLVGYHTDSALNQPLKELQSRKFDISGIGAELDRVRGATIHAFEIEADKHKFQVFVQGSTVITLAS